MKCNKMLSIIMLALFCTPLWAQVADPVDVLDYDLSVDLSQGRPFAGDVTLTVRLAGPCPQLALSLRGTADSVWVDGERQPSADLSALPLAGHAAGDTLTVRVCYHGQGYVESYGWGGFHFDSDMSYNLGVGFNVDPHVMGSALLPCRDNFYDKATYTLRVRTRQGWTAQCGGELVSRTPQADGTERSVWRIGQPVPTYLVSVSQAAWNRMERTVPGLYGSYPLTLGYTTQNSTLVRRAFANLDSVAPMYERCLGPYRWGRIGYIATQMGSMEHVNNIALDRRFMTSTAERAQMTIAHELGHAWFGNLVTCAGEEDMWINEGGASFCSELAMEAIGGRAASDAYYQTNLEAVLRQAHLTDGGYRPLSPMPHEYTYGSTTYDKGALVWHSLRGWLGDSAFYAAMQRLMQSKAFGNCTAAELRDSLSLYSGQDLTDFFRFHVFQPGFADYYVNIDTTGCRDDVVDVVVRQQGVGTDSVAPHSRVPLTFFSATGDTARRVAEFWGESTVENFVLPFHAQWVVMDYDLELSDASTLAVFSHQGSTPSKATHMLLSPTPAAGTTVAVEHHWGRPWHVEGTPGVVRTAQRYWIVRGTHQRFEGLKGSFRYVRDGNEASSYAHLDPGLVATQAELDSLVLLYRPGQDYEWRAVSRQRSGTADEGFLVVNHLAAGEYTLAVADPAVLAVDAPAPDPAPALFPNPVARGEVLTLEVPADDAFTVRIFDAAGRRVWQRRGCRSGQKISPRLASGTYLVQIENKFVSLQSKLIVL